MKRKDEKTMVAMADVSGPLDNERWGMTCMAKREQGCGRSSGFSTWSAAGPLRERERGGLWSLSDIIERLREGERNKEGFFFCFKALLKINSNHFEF